MMNIINEQLRGERKKDSVKFVMVTKARILKITDALVGCKLWGLSEFSGGVGERKVDNKCFFFFMLIAQLMKN